MYYNRNLEIFKAWERCLIAIKFVFILNKPIVIYIFASI